MGGRDGMGREEVKGRLDRMESVDEDRKRGKQEERRGRGGKQKREGWTTGEERKPENE